MKRQRWAGTGSLRQACSGWEFTTHFPALPRASLPSPSSRAAVQGCVSSPVAGTSGFGGRSLHLSAWPSGHAFQIRLPLWEGTPGQSQWLYVFLPSCVAGFLCNLVPASQAVIPALSSPCLCAYSLPLQLHIDLPPHHFLHGRLLPHPFLTTPHTPATHTSPPPHPATPFPSRACLPPHADSVCRWCMCVT